MIVVLIVTVFFDAATQNTLDDTSSRELPGLLKRVKCEIRPGKPNGPIGEPNRPISTRPKKVEPILSRGPLTG